MRYKSVDNNFNFKKMKTAIVVTTIRVPYALDTYIANCRKYGHEDVFFVVIADKQTPREAARYILSLKKKGYESMYLGITEQQKWLQRFPLLRKLLPYNSIQRRNIGYLYAAEKGADVIVSVDDDNYALASQDYIGEHLRAGMVQDMPAVSSSSGWFNACSFLNTKPKKTFYHRGFPLTKYWLGTDMKWARQKKKVAVNVGLWLGDPDVDTFTRLEQKFLVVSLNKQYPHFALAPGTSHPFNSQNTAFTRQALPCFFLITIGKIWKGFRIDNFRYDDIWMSYFAKKIIDHLGEQIVFGKPLVYQKRNPHDYLKDMRDELFPMIMTTKLVEIIDGIKLHSSTYTDAYAEVIEYLATRGISFTSLDSREKKCLRKIIEGMRIWLKACSEVLGYRMASV